MLKKDQLNLYQIISKVEFNCMPQSFESLKAKLAVDIHFHHLSLKEYCHNPLGKHNMNTKVSPCLFTYLLICSIFVGLGPVVLFSLKVKADCSGGKLKVLTDIVIAGVSRELVSFHYNAF